MPEQNGQDTVATGPASRPKKRTGNLPHSIAQRLLNQAVAEGLVYEKLLVDYATNRFLYRLSQSAHASQFVLKGGLMLRAWCGAGTRPTRDIDFQGLAADGDAGAIVGQIREILSAPFEDGLVFPHELCAPMPWQSGADARIVQMKCCGKIGNIRIPFQIDVAIGETSYVGASLVELPTYLGLPAPRLLCCSRENAVAEKFHAMVSHGSLNSRMKDFYDIWLLTRRFEFDSHRLVEAIQNVFRDRRTPLPTGRPEAFEQGFAKDKQTLWTAFIAKGGAANAPESFKEVMDAVGGFLAPLVPLLALDDPEPLHWDCSGPWQKVGGAPLEW